MASIELRPMENVAHRLCKVGPLVEKWVVGYVPTVEVRVGYRGKKRSPNEMEKVGRFKGKPR